MAGLCVASSGSAALIHSYDLTVSLNDALGGPALTGNPSNIGPSGYTFAAGAGGLTLSNALPDPATYTIRIVFQLDTVASQETWSNILNFHNSDYELYDYCGQSTDYGATDPCTVQLYPSTGAGGILSGVFTTLIFSRDGAHNLVQAWLDGAPILVDLDDSTGRAIFSDTNQIIRFFKDDPQTQTEDSPGVVSSIEIYDAVYTPADINGEPVPALAPWGLATLAILVLACGFAVLWRR
jgi:hypothetical protein